MRIAPATTLSFDQLATLEQWARSRSLPARVVERARIVQSAAEGRQDKQIASAMKITPKKVSRVQAVIKEIDRQPRSPQTFSDLDEYLARQCGEGP